MGECLSQMHVSSIFIQYSLPLAIVFIDDFHAANFYKEFWYYINKPTRQKGKVQITLPTSELSTLLIHLILDFNYHHYS